MKAALVIELSGNSAVLMKTGGEFVTVRAKQGWAEGDIVPINEQTRNFKAIYAAAACLALALICTFGGYTLYNTETALVSIDINPSIELGLNRFDRVISTTHYNVDGEKVLDSLDLHGKKYDAALYALFRSKALTPYLEDNDYLDIVVHGNDLIRERIEQHAQSIAKSYCLQLNCRQADDGTVAAAHEHGMTAGRYLAFLELQKLDPTVNIKDYCTCGLSYIRKEMEMHHQHQNDQQGGHDVNEDLTGYTAGHDENHARQVETHDGQDHGAQPGSTGDTSGHNGHNGHDDQGNQDDQGYGGGTPAPNPPKHNGGGGHDSDHGGGSHGGGHH